MMHRRRPSRALVQRSLNLPPALDYYQDPHYTTNLCTNPSFESGLTGWTATDSGTALAQTGILVSATGQVISGVARSLYGAYSMQVTTDGTLRNQGVVGPAASVPVWDGPVVGSMTVGLFGETGVVEVSAVSNPGGVVLATALVPLNGTWQKVQLNNLLYPTGAENGSVYLVITTAYAQDITFNVDGVSYQLQPTAHAYVDGSSQGGTWTGTAGLSSSYQQYQFGLTATLSFSISGDASLVAQGEALDLGIPAAVEFSLTPVPQGGLGIFAPAAALTDFGLWTSQDPDPAQSYGWWTNAGIMAGETNYSRPYAMVVPPRDYVVSNGSYAWRRAQWAAVGFRWLNVPAQASQVLTDVQLEICPTSPATATTPRPYQRPRQLQVVVKPNRLNFCPNPAIAVSTQGWAGINGDEQLAQDDTQSPGEIGSYDGLPVLLGQSLRCDLESSASLGASITISYLIAGETYICSFYTQPGAQVADILGQCGSGSADLASVIAVDDGYGDAPYGSGPFGGVYEAQTALPQVWTRVSFAFVAGASTETLDISAQLVPGANLPVSFWVAGVLIENGDVLQPYFDGDSGADALWETGQTAGLTRSYYYNQLRYGQSIVEDALRVNTPLGISYAPPLYALPPAQ